MAVLSTLVSIGLVYGAVWGGKRAIRWWRESEGRPEGNRGWKQRFLSVWGTMGRHGRRLRGSVNEGLNEDREDEERRPLLG